MTILKSDVVVRSLTKKGFERGTGKHIKYQFYYKGMKIPVITHLSHNGQEIDDFLIKQMAEQLHLSKSEFVEMVSCTIGYDELVDKYIALSLIQPND